MTTISYKHTQKDTSLFQGFIYLLAEYIIIKSNEHKNDIDMIEKIGDRRMYSQKANHLTDIASSYLGQVLIDKPDANK